MKRKEMKGNGMKWKDMKGNGRNGKRLKETQGNGKKWKEIEGYVDLNYVGTVWKYNSADAPLWKRAHLIDVISDQIPSAHFEYNF